MKEVQMTPNKRTNILRRLSQEAGTAKVQRQRAAKRAVVRAGPRDFWRALSALQLASPSAPVLRRLRD